MQPRGDRHTGIMISVYPRRKSRATPEIVASILDVFLEGTKKTKIMYKANLTTRSLHKYLESLVRLGLLEKTESYRTTEKGRTYLELFRCMENLAGEFNVSQPVIESHLMSGSSLGRPKSPSRLAVTQSP
jgi:predicted transcriptional regulator